MIALLFHSKIHSKMFLISKIHLDIFLRGHKIKNIRVIQPEAILPIRRIHKLRRAPLLSKMFYFSFIFEFGQQL